MQKVGDHGRDRTYNLLLRRQTRYPLRHAATASAGWEGRTGQEGEDARKSWRKELMCETYGHGYGVTIMARMVTDGRWKYVCTDHGLDELYDLKNDPYELKNLALLKEYGAKREEMRDMLRRQQELTGDPVAMDQLIVCA